MEYPINLPGLEYGALKLVMPGFWGKPKLYLNDFELEKLNDRYTVSTNADEPVFISLKNNFLDPIPKVFVNNKELEIARRIKWYEYIWTGLPVLMVLQGGLLGVGLGLVALRVNLQIFRSDKNTFVKYLLTLAVSLAFTLGFLVLALLIRSLLVE